MNKNILKFLGLGLISFVFAFDSLYAQNPFNDLLVQASAGRKAAKTQTRSSSSLSGTEFAYNNSARNVSDVSKSAGSDSVKKDNRIEKFYRDGDIIKVKVKVADENEYIVISAYNMLGRKVLDIYSGKPKSDGTYDINYQTLQNGMYICIVQGSDFKLAEKFVISR